MGDWLMYWKEHWIDCDHYDPLSGGWHTEQQFFYDQVMPGDSLWIVINGGTERPEDWLLFERIVAAGKKMKNKPRPYFIIGDPKKSERFDLEGQDNFEPVLHKLQFRTGTKIRTQGPMIGRSLQRIRPLCDKDTVLLEGYSKRLAHRTKKHTRRKDKRFAVLG